MRNLYDLLSLAYLLVFPALIVLLWQFGFQWWLYLPVLFFGVGVHVIHHNHVHLGIWNNKRFNWTTNLYISAITAVPTAMMVNGHIKNHHAHKHGPKDVTRTYRFGGDHNHLLGYLLHPFQAFFVLFAMFVRQFLESWPLRPKGSSPTRFAKAIAGQVVLIATVWLTLAVLDWQKFLLFVLLPQTIGLHWLLASNYFQHAHCDDGSTNDYARNFTGAINWIWFNIGYHTAHHDHPRAHWSSLPSLHRVECQDVHPQLVNRSFVYYCVDTYFLGLFLRSRQSQSMRSVGSDGTTRSAQPSHTQLQKTEL